MKESVGVVLLAGGVGKRAGYKIPKQLMLLGGKPMLVHSLEKIESIAQVKSVVIPCAEEAIEKTSYVLDAWGFDTGRFEVVKGGRTRQESVANGLATLNGCEYVLIHEAARPLVSVDDFQRLISCVEPNAILGAPVPFTVIRVDGATMSGLLNRDALVNVQLPQIFECAKLQEAHELARAAGKVYTEDASLLFDQLGVAVAVLEGSQANIKITYPSDLIAAEAIYEDYVAGGTNV